MTQEKRAVLVLGMHRSGTSALTRIINLMGFSAPKTLMAATEANEAGFWESEVFMDLDERILKACGRADKVKIYSYSYSSPIWWNQIGSRVDRARNLEVINLSPSSSLEMAKLAQRNMQLQYTMQDGEVWVSGNGETLQIELTQLKG